MLDFSLLETKEMTMNQLVADLTVNDLRRLTNEMIDTMLEMIEPCEDFDVSFVPEDPDAFDPAAEREEDIDLAWTLGHVIVHTTASAEESAALGAELARGVPRREGRSRSEIPWQKITTVAQCRHRLEESRRMRLASLDMWPDEPYLDNTYTGRSGEEVNAVVQFVFGLLHDDSHLDHLKGIIRQAQVARGNFISQGGSISRKGLSL
jgi:hypothetical protein